MHVDTGRMTRIKRTYNLNVQTISRVKELASDYGVADTQDRVVEIAIDRLYAEKRDEEEAALWAAAAKDPAFKREMVAVREVMDDKAGWPR